MTGRRARAARTGRRVRAARTGCRVRAAGAIAVLSAAIALVLLGHGAWIHVKARLAQVLLAESWRRTVAGETAVKPWPWADTFPVARLKLNRLGQDLIVLSGASGRSLAFGPGHLDGTPLPGQLGNSIVGGHRDTSLRFLRNVAVGDRIELQTRAGDWRSYRIAGTEIADARRPWIGPDPDAPMLTLVTCYPFDAVVAGGPLRYLVFAEALRGSEATSRPAAAPESH